MKKLVTSLAALLALAAHADPPCIMTLQIRFADECHPEAAMFGTGARPSNCGTWCWNGLDIMASGTNCPSANGPYFEFHIDLPQYDGTFLLANIDGTCLNGGRIHCPVYVPAGTYGGTLYILPACSLSTNNCGVMPCLTVSIGSQ